MSIIKPDKNKSLLLLSPKHQNRLNNHLKLIIILKIIIWFKLKDKLEEESKSMSLN